MINQLKVETPELPESARIPEELGKDACPWLDGYIKFSQTWSPRSFHGFHEACGLWVMSTVAARRVKTEFGGPRFTPLYVLLTGRSSLYAKTTAAKIALDVLRKAGLNFLLAPDQSTPQKYLSLLSARIPDGYDSWNEEKKEMVKKRLALQGARGWFHEEFGTHINAMMQANGVMADFRGLLRRFDDCPESYESATIGRDSDFVERPYLALLGNLTPADLRKYARKGSELWGDGFLARFAIVSPQEEEEANTGRFPGGNRIVPDELIVPLKRWCGMLGLASVKITVSQNNQPEHSFELEITPGPVTMIAMSPKVVDLHYAYMDGLSEICKATENHDLDANYVRFPEKALRIATLCASMTNSPSITIEHWARAQSITERWRAGLHGLYLVVNDDKTKAKDEEEKVLDVIDKKGFSTPTEIARFIRSMGVVEVKHTLDGLVGANVLIIQKKGKCDRYGFPTEKT